MSRDPNFDHYPHVPGASVPVSVRVHQIDEDGQKHGVLLMHLTSGSGDVEGHAFTFGMSATRMEVHFKGHPVLSIDVRDLAMEAHRLLFKTLPELPENVDVY